MERESYFNKALSNFVKDFACKNEILAKHKRGLLVKEIREELLFKISEADIQKIIDTYNEKDDFVRVVGPYGSVSFIKKNYDSK